MPASNSPFPAWRLALAGIACLPLIPAAFAGQETAEKEVVAPAPYEAGRGLITLEGPSGMFINPTSATLPKGAYTAQYCLFFPEPSDRYDRPGRAGELWDHGLARGGRDRELYHRRSEWAE